MGGGNRTTCDNSYSHTPSRRCQLCDFYRSNPRSNICSVHNSCRCRSSSLPPLSASHSLFSHIVPAFRRSFFVWCWPSRKPFAYVVSSKHRTPLYSAPFKALIKRRPRAVNGTADGGLLPPLQPRAKPNIGQAGLRP